MPSRKKVVAGEATPVDLIPGETLDSGEGFEEELLNDDEPLTAEEADAVPMDADEAADAVEDDEALAGDEEGGERRQREKIAQARADELREAESLSSSAKQNVRDQLAAEVEAFLKQGGRITELPPDDDAN